MKHFFVLLCSLILFITFDTTCMFRLVLQKKRNLSSRRIFSNHKGDHHDSAYLLAEINALEKIIISHEEVMFQQHLIINNLKNKLNLPASDHINHCPTSHTIHTNGECVQTFYIPEHNMHYGNKDHE